MSCRSSVNMLTKPIVSPRVAKVKHFPNHSGNTVAHPVKPLQSVTAG